MYPQWNAKYERHNKKVWHDKPNIFVHIAYTFHKVFSYEKCHFDNGCNRHLIEERNYAKFYDNNKRKKFVKMNMIVAII